MVFYELVILDPEEELSGLEVLVELELFVKDVFYELEELELLFPV